jgi:hypothetical protein
VNVLVQGIMSSRAGLRVDRSRLVQVIEDRLPDLLEGTRLRFDPVLRALLRVDGVTERDLYIGIVNVSIQLAQMGIELEPPELELDHATRLELLAEAQAEAERSRRASREADVRQRIRKLRSRKLGDLLVAEGLITGAQLAEALDAQKRYGGRLGTNLVEQGHMSEIELAHFLSLQLGVPSVTRLDQIGPDARAALPREVVESHRVIPTRVDHGEVHLAMADPLDIEAIDAVADATGRRVFPVVAPEILVAYALERYYGLPRPARFLGGRRPSELRVEDAPPLPEAAGALALRPEPTLDLPAAGAHLAGVETDAQIFGLVQDFMGQRAAISAVFIVEGERLRGWSHKGARISRGSFRSAALTLSEDAALGALAEGDGPAVLTGAPGTRLADLLGLAAEAHLVGLPLRRAGRLAALAVAVLEAGHDPEVDARFTRMVGAALEMVALRQHILDEAS